MEKGGSNLIFICIETRGCGFFKIPTTFSVTNISNKRKQHKKTKIKLFHFFLIFLFKVQPTLAICPLTSHFTPQNTKHCKETTAVMFLFSIQHFLKLYLVIILVELNAFARVKQTNKITKENKTKKLIFYIFF